ncbi:MAG: DNA-directed RNA polymerase subunit alpha [Bacilli bacterium]
MEATTKAEYTFNAEGEVDADKKNYGKFVISPLERGYGITIGNSLRRVLLSSMPGVAIVAIEIEGVSHEFMAVPGVREDVTEIILNLKKLVFKIPDEILFAKSEEGTNTLYKMTLDVNGPCEVKAGDLQMESNISIVNTDAHIATLEEGGKFVATFYACRGVGYVNSKDNKVFCSDDQGNIIVDRISIDSIYTPVTKCNYNVEKTRVGDNFRFDELTLEVWTNKSITPANAVSLASRFLVQHLETLSDLNETLAQNDYMYEQKEKVTDKVLDMKISELELSVRSFNCLRRADISTVGDLTKKTAEEMMKVRNLGRKSLKEIEAKLSEINHGFKSSYVEYDREDEDDEEDNSDETENVILDTEDDSDSVSDDSSAILEMDSTDEKDDNDSE